MNASGWTLPGRQLLYKRERIPMEQEKKYSFHQNLTYCVRSTRQGCPKLLFFCLLVILANCLVPVVTAYLPKVVIEQITEGKPLRQLLIVTAALTGGLALLGGLQKYMEQLIYWNKFTMNTFFLRLITRKGLTTDYRNQERIFILK